MDHLLEPLRELLATIAPGLVTKDDLARLEQKVDELAELVSELEKKLPQKTE